jgi:hypothetical protein
MINLFLKNVYNLKILIEINIVEYKYQSNINIKQNNGIKENKRVTEVLSQEEIDLLLTAIVSDDEKK